MNVDQETIVNKFVAAIGELHASAGETPQHASADETPLHASADEIPLRGMGKRRPDRWRQIATWSLASIALFAVWMLGILSLDWLGGSR